MDEPLPPENDPDHLKVRRYEELYRLARETYATELQRFDAVESKADRYLAYLLGILGIAALKIGDFIDIALTCPATVGSILFMLAYSTLGIVSFVALCYLRPAVDVRKLTGPSVDNTLPDHFRHYIYVDVIYSTALSFFDWARDARETNDRKIAAIRKTYRLLAVVLVSAAVAVATFILLKIGVF